MITWPDGCLLGLCTLWIVVIFITLFPNSFCCGLDIV
jgi:hypothetical protein